MTFGGRPLEEAWGLRVIARLGPSRVVRVVFAIVWLGTFASLVTVHRPDLWWPAALGSDASNYFAAAERVLHGGEVYALAPGDRPVPADNPPAWSVPILSPPSLAVLWLPFAILPGGFGLVVPWALGAAACGVFGVWLARRAPALVLVLVTPLLGALALTAWSGNVNALLAPLIAIAWWLARPGDPRRQLTAGGIVALLALLKVTPIVLVIWLVAQRRWPAVSGVAAVGLVGALATAAVAGPASIPQYLAVAGGSATAPSGMGIPALLAGLGIQGAGGIVVLGLVLGAGALVAAILRRFEAVGFGLAVLLSVASSPVVRFESAALLLAALAPFLVREGAGSSAAGMDGRAPTAAAVTLAAVLVAAVAATGGLARTSMTIKNASGDPVVVRFAVAHQSATFGFLLAPGERVAAWHDIVGWTEAPALVFDLDCRLTGAAAVTPRTTAIAVRPDGPESIEDGAADASPFAPFASSCAAEARAIIEGPNQ